MLGVKQGNIGLRKQQTAQSKVLHTRTIVKRVSRSDLGLESLRIVPGHFLEIARRELACPEITPPHEKQGNI